MGKTLLEQYACPGCGAQSDIRVDTLNTLHCARCRLAFNAARTVHVEPGRYCPACDRYIVQQWPRHVKGRMHLFSLRMALVAEGVARG